MKKLNKKGFTIIELVIVIAVIAILAAVMIPTFSGIVEKSKKSAAEQEAATLYTEVMALDLLNDGVLNGELEGITASNGKYTIDGKECTYTTSDGKVASFEYESNGYKVSYDTKTGKLKEAEKINTTTEADN